MLLCPIVFGVCQIFNIISEKLLFHSEYFSTEVRTQQGVYALSFKCFFFYKDANIQVLFHRPTGVKMHTEVKTICRTGGGK